jgi:hypothetical protein
MTNLSNLPPEDKQQLPVEEPQRMDNHVLKLRKPRKRFMAFMYFNKN